MAGTAIGLAMKITADTAGVSAGVAQTEKLMTNLGRAAGNLDKIFGTSLGGAIEKASTAFGRFGVSLPTVLAGMAAFGTAATFVTKGLISLEDRIEKLTRLSTQLGVSFGFVEVLEEAGSRADVSIEQLRGSFARLQNTLAGSGEESKQATAALERLGLSVDEFGALSQEQQIRVIGDSLAAIEDPAKRSAAAIGLFGRSGVELIPLFRELPQAQADIANLGSSVNALDRDRLADFGSGIDAIGVAFRAFGQELLLPFTGLAEGVTKAFADVIGGAGDLFGVFGDIASPFLDLLGGVAQIAGSTIGVLLRLASTALEPIAAIFRIVGQSIEVATGHLDAFFGYINAGISEVQKFFALAPQGAADTAKAVGDAADEADRFADSFKRAADESLKQLRIEQEFGGDAGRAAAADRLIAVQQDIAKTETDIQKLREDGDQEGVAALQERLAKLREAAAREEDIASGAKQAREDAEKQEEKRARKIQKLVDDLADNESKAADEAQKKREEYAGRLADLQSELVRSEIENNAKIADQREQFAERVADIEANRLDALSRQNQEALQVNDLRSGGISQFLALATGREDPAVAEARAQRKELEKIAAEIRKLGGTVELVGAA